MAGSPHAYPDDLSEVIARTWDAAAPKEGETACLPAESRLLQLVSIAYQASHLTEESRPVTFRILYAPPSQFDPEGGPPAGLQPLVFRRTRAFAEHELRRLSPAAPFFRTYIGVFVFEDQLRIWGLIEGGARWVDQPELGRENGLPDSLLLHVRGPGRVAAFRGRRRLATLIGGQLEGYAFDVFASKWLPATFANVREGLFAELIRKDLVPAERLARIEPGFAKYLAQSVIRRTISLTRNEGHGGTMLFVPPDDETFLYGDEGPFSYKYSFTDGPARGRFRRLLLRILARFATVEALAARETLRVKDYEEITDAELVELDEALAEVAHSFADFMSVDGALVLNLRFEILGFGAEITAGYADLLSVGRALDLEGTQTQNEATEKVGTRHRSVYRLVNRFPGCLGVVVSQDGSVRFVGSQHDRVTYWDQLAI